MDESLEPLTEQLRAGETELAEQVFSLYSMRLARVAEQHLSRKLAARLDAEDVVQSVFRTFFRRGAEGKFQINNSAQLRPEPVGLKWYDFLSETMTFTEQA